MEKSISSEVSALEASGLKVDCATVDPASPGRAIRVAIVEDEQVLLESLRHFLATCPGFAQPDCFMRADAAVVELTRTPADIALVDIHLGGESGLDCISRIRAARGARFVVAHTVADDQETLGRAFAAGAHGYLIKSPRLGDLHKALEQLLADGVTVSTKALSHIIQSFRQPLPKPVDRAGLTETEWQVLSATAEGLGCKAIALRLHVALNTVYVHNRRIFSKLGVHTRLQAVARYRELVGASNVTVHN